MAESSPLHSRALGSATHDLIRPCQAPGPRAAQPDTIDPGPGLALAFSGGGFRATLAALGVGRFLADAGLLSRIRYLSATSGGSLAAGLLACRWQALRDANFAPDAYDREVVRTLVDRISRDSLETTLLLNIWRTIGSTTRTDLLARYFDEWFFQGHELADLPSGVRFVFNAANLSTGVRFGFERDVVGDYVLGHVTTKASGLRVAQAAAASAAVPGPFPPMTLSLPFPCAEGRSAVLVDGGTYDNLGIEVVSDLPESFLISINAGGLFQTSRRTVFPFVSLLQRASGLLYRQSIVLRTRTMVERFAAFERARAEGVPPPPFARQGVLFGLATTMGNHASPEWLDGRPEPSFAEIEALALTPTSFERFPAELCEKLIHRGWWLTGATLANFHRPLLGTLPSWRPLR